MPQKTISILVPFKNTEMYISECIDSILNQTCTDWEAIFIDDGSTDHAFSIVNNYAKKDKRILLYKNDGFGIIAALQNAFSYATGSYITRMDSDDIMTVNRLEIMLNSLLSYGKKHVAIGLVKYFKDNGVGNGYAKYEKWLNGLTRTGTNYSEIYKECVIPSPCWMLHREDLVACEGFEPNRYPEDYDLAFRFYKAGYTCIPCNEILLYWRDYSTRTSRTHKHYAQNSFLDLKVHYFLELDYDATRPLTLWGAGTKGKAVAKLFIKQNVPFYWICDNPKKIGKHIYNQDLLRFNFLQQLQHPQSIVTVANEDAQKEINAYFKEQSMMAMNDYFFFC